MLRLISGTDTIGDIGKKNNEKVDNPSLADITALKVITNPVQEKK